MSDVIAGIFLLIALLSAAVFSFRLVTTLVRLGRVSASWEIRILGAALLSSSILVLLVEVLSLLRLLSTFGLAAGWLIVSLLLHTTAQKFEAESKGSAVAPPLFPSGGTDWDAEERWLRGGITWTLPILFVIALFTAPTTLDPIAHDLTRVLHWIQNGSVASYATDAIPGTRVSPFSAFAFLHAFLLSDSDQLVKLVPWIATVLTLVALSAMVAVVSPPANRKAKLWTAAAGLALLLVFNLAPSPANSLGALFLISLAVFGLRLKGEPGNIVYACGLGIAASLCLLTSPLVALIALILAAVALFSSTGCLNTGKARVILATLLPAVVLAAPQILRDSAVLGTAFSLRPSSIGDLRLLLFLVLPFFGIGIIGRRAKIAFGLALTALAFAALLLDRAQPILTAGDFVLQPREHQRFHGAAASYEPAAQAADDLIFSGVTNIAVHVSSAKDPLAQIEYAFLAMLNGRGFDGAIHQVRAGNETRPSARPPSPQALISSAASIEGLDLRLPYKLTYGPLASYWSELDSRWVQLAEIRPDKSRRMFSSTEQELIVFQNKAAILSCRVPRQGVLTLDGGFGDTQGLVDSATALSVKSRAGFMITSRSTNALHIVEIPLPPGQTDFQLAPAFQLPPDTVFALRSWSWYPTEQPLPFISVSKITSTSLEPNTLILGAGSDLTIELISGAEGIIDLQVYARDVDAIPISIANNSLRTNATFQTGAAIARLLINRGTNQFTISSPATNALLIDRIEPRFRDFVE